MISEIMTIKYWYCFLQGLFDKTGTLINCFEIESEEPVQVLLFYLE